jgi:hypothetical protein
MFEATTNRTTRNAMETAHQERARALASMWGWLFTPASR